MATNPKSAELSLDGDFLLRKHTSAKSGRFWRWFLAGALLNVCIVSVSVSLTVLYVQTELQSLREKILIQEDRLARLEVPSSAGDTVRVPTWKFAQLRNRRDRESKVSMGGSFLRNATLSARPEAATELLLTGIRLFREISACDQGSQESGYPTLKPSGGDTYVRWGRTTCPNDIKTELIYAGTVGGSYFSHKGGSVDFFCLPSQPEWAPTYSDSANSQSYLYGAEYELPFDPFSHDNAEFLNNHDIPCAVCRLLDRGTQLLFPAKLGCPEDWTEEYRGFLMSGKYSEEQRSKAVCVDQAPEAIPGSQGNREGSRLYIVEGQCGSLLCPPYVNGREITCTVCSI
ncbi:uncharacterized protein LOC110990063 [Acanthaster planci]|uniref:Uncharacterized protein LOC110990063 n=1 Tax=Acanthaster planci TaxID=133434 RepID=A0A8B8A0N8_ACAPL|nr:uncharacterized protein LOC110990063 [Acanthaster planci]